MRSTFQSIPRSYKFLAIILLIGAIAVIGVILSPYGDTPMSATVVGQPEDTTIQKEDTVSIPPLNVVRPVRFPTRLHILAEAVKKAEMDSSGSRAPAFFYRTQRADSDLENVRIEIVGAKCPKEARGQALGTKHWMCYMSTTEAQEWLSWIELQFDTTPRMVFLSETKPIERVELSEPGFLHAFEVKASVNFPTDFSVDVIPGSENPQCPTEKFPAMEGGTGYTCVLTSPEELARLIQNWGWKEGLENLQTNKLHGVFGGEDLEYTGEWPPTR